MVKKATVGKPKVNKTDKSKTVKKTTIAEKSTKNTVEELDNMNIVNYIENKIVEFDLDITTSKVLIGIKSMKYRNVPTEEKKVDKFINTYVISKNVNTYVSKPTIGVDFAITGISNIIRNNMNIIPESKNTDRPIGIAGSMRKCFEDGSIWDSRSVDSCPVCGDDGVILATQGLPKGHKILKKDGSNSFDGSIFNYKLVNGLIRLENTEKWEPKTVKFIGSKMQFVDRLCLGNIAGFNLQEDEYEGEFYYSTNGSTTYSGLYGEDITFGDIFKQQVLDVNGNEVFAHIDTGRDITNDGYYTVAFEILEAPIKSDETDKYKIVMHDALAENSIGIFNFWTSSDVIAEKLTPKDDDTELINGIVNGRFSRVEMISDDELGDDIEFGWKANLNMVEDGGGIPIFMFDESGELVNIDEYVSV